MNTKMLVSVVDGLLKDQNMITSVKVGLSRFFMKDILSIDLWLIEKLAVRISSTC